MSIESCQTRFSKIDKDAGAFAIPRIANTKPGLDLYVALQNMLNHLLNVLEDDELPEVVVLRMTRNSDKRMASHSDGPVSTIERQPRVIQSVWKSECDA